MNRVCIFVDGENFRKTIAKLYKRDFSESDYLPKQADWAGFFDWLAEEQLQGIDSPKRLRAYWYVTEGVDFSPWNYSKLPNAEELKNRKAKFNDRFNGWQVVQDAISRRQQAIEFRRAGAIRYDLPERSLGREKAVDVKLATDMILFKDNYDVAMIISGDQDFAPAVQAVKNFGKTVVNVAFLTAEKDLLPGGARRLNQRTDASIEVDHEVLRGYLFPRS